ncbi:LOW QUALITY PROTEIN: protein NYNRIN-like [Rhinophrynus dorsalis]
MKMETSHLPTVSETQLEDPDLVLFVDGSRYVDIQGRYHTGYAVTTTDTVVQAGKLPPTRSAQEAELQALTAACKLSEGKRANIHTDSRYAFGVAHDFGVIWKTRGFLTGAGTPVKHHQAVRELMEALTLPTQVAILKVKAHGKVNTEEAKGNHLADQMAKQAALGQREPENQEEAKPILILNPHPQDQGLQYPLTDRRYLQKLQTEVNPKEPLQATQDRHGLYGINRKPCLPRCLYPAVVQWAHGLAHLSKTLMNSLIQKYFVAPGISTLTDRFCRSCSICAMCNPGMTEKTPKKHLAKPLYPFQRIQIDHIQMPKSGRFEYALVVVDMFSGCPEAYPVTNMTAKTTAKKLLSEIVCRYGVPEVIESDQGPAFTAMTKDIWAALGVELAFHMPYHPQSNPETESGAHDLKPGDWVLVKKFVRKHSLELRHDGPCQVLLITATCLDGKSTWIHASHCKKTTAPEEAILGDSAAQL